jgi:MOSC domain-containing protein YiiM
VTSSHPGMTVLQRASPLIGEAEDPPPGQSEEQSHAARFHKKEKQRMKLISVNTGLPREVRWHGRSVTTAIFKEPVKGRIILRKLNLEVDRQADLTVHGGKDKAAYCYSLAHYEYWSKELPGHDLPMGSFGENFTINGITAIAGASGLAEDAIHLGDQFSVGTAEVVVTQPRLPCYKLGVRFGSDDMVRRFMVSGRTGYYVAVTREGEVGAGDEIKPIGRDANAVAVSEITRLYVAKRYGDADVASARRVLQVAALSESWKAYFRERLEKAGAKSQ